MSLPGCQKMSAKPCNRNAEESFPVLSLQSREQKPPNPLLIQDKNVLQPSGDLSHLLKITTYITKIEDFPAVAEVRSSVFQGELPASTLIVVKSLFHPDFLIEVEGVEIGRA